MEKFEIAIPQWALDDVQRRLASTRWPIDVDNDDWSYGVNGAYLHELVDYWRTEYDWRAHEARMNAYPHFRTTIDGVPIHFIHQRGVGPDPIPLIASHGWPWTFWDYQKVIGPLTDPASHGGDPHDAFDLVVPSLPGFGFSVPMITSGMNFWRTADLWAKLMGDELGYDRFGAQGGDWGMFITSQLGHKYADRVIGVHLHVTAPLNFFDPGALPDVSAYQPDELHHWERNQRFAGEESGYMALQTTRPQTGTFALNDSPVGLCSWLIDLRRSLGDCHGDVESRFSKDDLLTTVMIYWLGESYGTSARFYFEAAHDRWTPSHDRTPVVEAPTGLCLLPGDCFFMPRAWNDTYYNLHRYREAPAGGHFGPMEEPELLVEEIREFFRPLRSGQHERRSGAQ